MRRRASPTCSLACEHAKFLLQPSCRYAGPDMNGSRLNDSHSIPLVRAHSTTIRFSPTLRTICASSGRTAAFKQIKCCTRERCIRPQLGASDSLKRIAQEYERQVSAAQQAARDAADACSTLQQEAAAAQVAAATAGQRLSELEAAKKAAAARRVGPSQSSRTLSCTAADGHSKHVHVHVLQSLISRICTLVPAALTLSLLSLLRWNGGR